MRGRVRLASRNWESQGVGREGNSQSREDFCRAQSREFTPWDSAISQSIAHLLPLSVLISALKFPD